MIFNTPYFCNKKGNAWIKIEYNYLNRDSDGYAKIFIKLQEIIFELNLNFQDSIKILQLVSKENKVLYKERVYREILES